MTDRGRKDAQVALDQFGDGGADRPEGEARAVAGNGGQGADVVDLEDRRYPDADGRVEFAVTQVDYTVRGRGDDEYPVLHVFGRTAERDLEHVEVHEFRPYFYAPTDSLDAPPEQEYDRLTDSEETDENGDPYESIRGEHLTKIFGQTPRDVGNLRDEFDHYEADILFPNRLLIDKDIKSGVRVPERRTGEGIIRIPHDELETVEMQVEPRVCTFDIEVDDRRGFPEDGEEPVVCLTSHDSYRDEYVAWLYDAPDGDVPPPEAVADHDLMDADATVEIRSFDTEAAMLEAFVDYLDETDADITTGWNFADFDAPYLVARLDELGLDSDRLSRVGEVWDSGWGGPDVKGRVVFDLLYAYKRTQFTELESYRLDAVAETELGVGKERYAGDIGDLWEDDPERLLEYNLRDVELCVELDRKQNIIPFWEEVASFVGCKLEDATTPGDAVDMYVLHKVHGDFVLPSKGKHEGEDYEGGAVFDPITGVREMVSVLDLRSLYPMVMVTINASPETKVDEDYEDETYRAPNGTEFRKSPDGIIREMVDELLAEREQKKTHRDEHDPNTEAYERFDRQQAAVKVIMNCFTPDTEVLTPDGIRSITDLEVGDDVYSLDPETMELEVKPVVETHAYPDYRGELVDIETGKIDFRVTPNHRMLVRKNDKNGITEDEWGFVEAGDLHEYCHYEMPHGWSFDHGEGIDEVDLVDYVDGKYEAWVRPSGHGRTFTTDLGWQPPLAYKDDLGVEGYVFTPEQFERHREYVEDACERSYVRREAGRKWIPRTYDGDDFLELLAWYITEGNVYTSESKQYGEKLGGTSTTIQVAKELVADGGDGSDDDHARIGALLDRMGFDYYVDDRSYQFTSELLGDALQSLCGAGSHDKRIPEFVFDLSERQKRRFLETLIAGDGDRRRNSWRYSTASERLRDDVLRLCAHLGITASYSYDGDCWRIYVTEDARNSFRTHRSGATSEAEDGVYCVTVEDNHTLLAGRNGKLQFVGQSLYGTLGWERFRLYDREMANAVTFTGQEVIKFTESAANELDKEVIYGDSITGDRPVVVRDRDGIVRVLPIAELFERAEPRSGSEMAVEADGGAVDGNTNSKERAALRDWKALSLSSAGDPEWQPIEQVIRHETDKGVVKLQHKFGESVTTRDHSYVIEDDGGFLEAPPEDVDEPLRVPGLPEVESVDVIDVYEVLDGYEREYEDGRGTGGTTVKTKRVHANEEHVWFGHQHYDEFDSTVMVQRYIERGTAEFDALLRLLAAYVSEGSATTTETVDSRFCASIAESRTEWLEQLQADYHRLFANTTTSIIDSDTRKERTVEYSTDAEDVEITYADRTRKLQMMNELSAVFFREFAGQTSRGKRLPGFVFNLPRDDQDLFLDVLVEGDGSREFPRYSEAYAERNFDFETTSRELAAGLSMLLVQRGKKHSLKYRDSKDSYTVRTCDYYRSGRSPVLTDVDHEGYVYDLSVTKNENFVDGVGGIVLHNTDSVMLELGGDVSKEEAIEQSFELEEYINGRYDEFAREELGAEFHRFEIEFEKLYRRFFQAGKKKRYAGHAVWKEGKDVDDIDITGFEYKRSDIAPITKEVQHEVIEMIVKGEDIEEVKSYLHEVIEDFLAGNVSLDEVGIPGGIGKRLDNYDTDTAQVRGAKYANLLLGTNFQRGSKPKRLYLEKVHPEFFRRIEREEGLDPAEDPLYAEFKRDPDVICFEYPDQVPDEFEVDWDKMLEKTLRGPIARVLEALDVSWEEVKSGQEQTGLGKFM